MFPFELNESLHDLDQDLADTDSDKTPHIGTTKDFDPVANFPDSPMGTRTNVEPDSDDPWYPFETAGLPGTKRRADAYLGTKYICTQNVIDSLQDAPHGNRANWRPKAVIPMSAKQLRQRYSDRNDNWWRIDHGAVENLQSIETYKGPVGRDIVFKIFKDLDDALFGGTLLHRVRIMWFSNDGEYYSVDASKKDSIKVYLNAATLTGKSWRLLGALLHCLVHAFMRVQTILPDGRCSGPQHKRRKKEHDEPFFSILSAVSRRLGHAFELFEEDAEACERYGQLPYLRQREAARSHLRNVRDARQKEELQQRKRAPHRPFGTEKGMGHENYFADNGQEDRAWTDFEGFPESEEDFYAYGSTGREYGRKQSYKRSSPSGSKKPKSQRRDEGSGFQWHYYEPSGTESGRRPAGSGYQRPPSEDYWQNRTPSPPRTHQSPPPPPPPPAYRSTEFDPYKVLGINMKATAEEIMRAYKKLALEHHPDKAPVEKKDEATESMKKINTARDILTDRIRRANFDAWGHL